MNNKEENKTIAWHQNEFILTVLILASAVELRLDIDPHQDSGQFS